jgi:hypothetical protein
MIHFQLNKRDGDRECGGMDVPFVRMKENGLFAPENDVYPGMNGYRDEIGELLSGKG